jgi:uncharacterized protein YllA (UPF0747 family)
LKFQDLPEIPSNWIDFIAGRCPGLSVSSIPYGRKFLHSHLEQVKRQFSRFEKPVREAIKENSLDRTPAGESIQRLQQSGSVAVVANIEARIFGGNLSQFLKCLTAVGVCRELAGHAINAVPVFWVYKPEPGLPNPADPVRMLDARSELHRLMVPEEESSGFPSGPTFTFDRISSLIEQVEGIGEGSFDPEILEMLKTSYSGDATWSSACTGLVSALMNEWGVVVVDSEAEGFVSKVCTACGPLVHKASGENRLREGAGNNLAQTGDTAPDCPETSQAYRVQSCILPVFARIVDPCELSSYMEAQQGFDSTGLVPPISWPTSSATVIDTRRRKIMEKYAVGLQDLLKGEAAVLRHLSEKMILSSIETKLDSLKTEVERHIAGLNDSGMEGKSFRKVKKRSRERIAFQLDKIRRRVEKSRLEKKEVMQRQIQRACGYLVPDGIRQENGLAGISFPLRYSRFVLSFILENLDIMKFEHQLIYLK